MGGAYLYIEHLSLVTLLDAISKHIQWAQSMGLDDIRAILVDFEADKGIWKAYLHLHS